MKNLFFLCLTLSILSSCSNLSKNMVTKGELNINGGVSGKEAWEDSLSFNRTSWYKELTLLFDLLITEVDENSPFNQWFSDSVKDRIKKCQEFYVVGSYALDSDRISRNEIFGQIEKEGFEKWALPSFGKNVKLHPDNEPRNLQLYDIHGVCRKKLNAGSDLEITLPGFETTPILFTVDPQA